MCFVIVCVWSLSFNTLPSYDIRCCCVYDEKPQSMMLCVSPAIVHACVARAGGVAARARPRPPKLCACIHEMLPRKWWYQARWLPHRTKVKPDAYIVYVSLTSRATPAAGPSYHSSMYAHACHACMPCACISCMYVTYACRVSMSHVLCTNAMHVCHVYAWHSCITYMTYIHDMHT